MLEIQDPTTVTEQIFFDCMRPPGQPLLLRGGAASWQCASLWTFDYFAKLYGEQPLPLLDCLLHTKQKVESTVREYLEYVQSPGGTRLERMAIEAKMTAPFYAYGCKPFEPFPELRAHFQLPAYAHDWCQDMPEAMRKAFYPNGCDWLLFSGTGARSVLHRDDGSTIAWFAQMKGHKSFIVHVPSEGPLMYNGLVDPTAPDLDQFPNYALSKPVRFELHPGDLVFLPSDWYHYVRTESPSITLTGNLVTHVNIGDYLRYAYKDKVSDFLGLLPTPAQVLQSAKVPLKADGGMKMR